MSLFIDQSYKNQFTAFPKDDIPNDQKNNQWFLQWAKAMYGYYLDDKCAVKYSERDIRQELRDFAAGRQNSSQYMDILLGEKDITELERKGFMNINFNDIYSPAPTYLDSIIGMFEGVDHEITALAVDEKATIKKDIEKEKLWLKSLFKDKIQAINQTVGAIQPKEEILPESRDELEMFGAMGGFKLDNEIAQEELLYHTFNISKWKSIKRKLLYDFASLNMAAVIDKVDSYDGLEKFDYLDVNDLIIENCPNDNFRKARFAGIPLQYSIVDLRTESNGEISEDELKSIAIKYSGSYGNGSMNTWGTDIDFVGKSYDNMRIPVLYGSVISTYNVETTDDIEIKGKVKPNEIKSGKIKVKNGKNIKEKPKYTEIRTVYHFKWIIGTEIIFGGGLMNDIVRDKKFDVVLPIHFVKLSGKSIVEKMRPILDQIQLTFLKLQNNIAISRPPGLSVEWGCLQNVTIGKEKMKPNDLIKMVTQTGNVIYRATPFHGHVQSHFQAKPIEELKGGMGSTLDDAIRCFELFFNQLSAISGIDRITMGQTPQREVSATATNLAVAATNNVLKPMYGQYIQLKEYAAENASYRIQLICYNSKKPEDCPYYDVIGKKGVEALQKAANYPPACYGINIYARPTEQIKQDIKQIAIEVMKTGAITMGEYLFITEKLNSGSGIAYSRAYLTYREQKKKEMELKLQRENMTIQNEGNIKLEQVKNADEIKIINAQADADVKVEYYKAYFAALATGAAHKQELEKIALKLHLEGINSTIEQEIGHGVQTQQNMQQQQMQNQQPTV